MPQAHPVLYSVLDLSPIVSGGTPADSFRNSRDLARHAERLGYTRYWVAEHHNIQSVASAATSVLIGHIAGATEHIRVGSGGIMLPNHAPLVIAEQFGTLEALYPGRIDLGLGRAPGGDQRSARALRRGLATSGDTFPQDLAELISYFGQGPSPITGVRAVPGEGTNIPIYLLGSSDFSARLAAELGLPFAFASHFAPDFMKIAIDLYRTHFEPSAQLARPHVIVGVNVFAADTDAEAARLFTSIQQQFLTLIRGNPQQLPLPVDEVGWSPPEQAQVRRMLRCSAVGSAKTVKDQLEVLLAETGADELMITAAIHDHAARLRSFEITADVMRQTSAEREAASRAA